MSLILPVNVSVLWQSHAVFMAITLKLGILRSLVSLIVQALDASVWGRDNRMGWRKEGWRRKSFWSLGDWVREERETAAGVLLNCDDETEELDLEEQKERCRSSSKYLLPWGQEQINKWKEGDSEVNNCGICKRLAHTSISVLLLIWDRTRRLGLDKLKDR